MCVCVCFVCLLIKLYIISAQSGPVILVILYATRINWSSHGSRCVCVFSTHAVIHAVMVANPISYGVI